MSTIGFVLCPNLKGSKEGSVCTITCSLIKDMEDFTVKLCMSQRHEACSVYMQSLQNKIEPGSCTNLIAADLR
ncbi:MAG: hypothetical protein HZA15_02850 [Nitrospirae bacterium]|nr:hypothetical protein [Nitrospirota bacterium]